MRALSAADLLTLWELGQRQHLLDRALTLLGAADPGRTRAELAALGIGERDRLLLDLRERTFGPTLDCVAACGACGGSVEFRFSVAEARLPFAPRAATFSVESDGASRCFRLPTSADLAAVAGRTDREAAARALLGRCLVEPGPGDRLTPDLARRAAERMSQLDPQAEVRLDLSCPSCGHRWEAVFDVAAWLWKELDARARRLLGEVHSLARAYGWTEAEILSLGEARRQAYLELIAS
jgi:hypothetical protein